MNHPPTTRDLKSPVVTLSAARVQGGNWSMHGFRRSSHVHDEAECQMSIAEFISEQAPPRSWDFI